MWLYNDAEEDEIDILLVRKPGPGFPGLFVLSWITSFLLFLTAPICTQTVQFPKLLGIVGILT